MSFKIENISIDPNKKTIIIYDKGDYFSYTHVYGTGRILHEQLSRQYNIVMFSNRSHDASIKNVVKLDQKSIDANYDRMSENKNAKVDNLNTFYSNLDEVFKQLKIDSVEYFIGVADVHFQLPFTNYVSAKEDQLLFNLKNTFFDSTSDDQKVLEKIEFHSRRIVNNMTSYVSMLAFISKPVFVGFFLPLYLHKKNMLKHECIFFSIDPTLFTPFFIEHGIPSRFMYFANDCRGNRLFEQFDIAQFQHIIYDQKFMNNILPFDIEQKKNLLFYGSIFQEKGPRQDVYYQFIHDLKISNSTLFIPFLKNKAVVKKQIERRHRHIDLDRFGDLYEDVKNHPLVEKQKILYPIDIPNELRAHKYNLIVRCVSPEDSLNFRPVLSVLYDCFPFIDHMYDPCNLQIPKEFNDALVVKSADDIARKIEYYNQNDDERIQIIKSLKKHFRIYEYLESPDLMVQQEIRRIIPGFTSDTN